MTTTRWRFTAIVMVLSAPLAGCGGKPSPDAKVDEAIDTLTQMTDRLDAVRTADEAKSAARELKPLAAKVRTLTGELNADRDMYDAEAFAAGARRVSGAIRRFRSELHRATLLNADTAPHLRVVEARLGEGM